MEQDTCNATSVVATKVYLPIPKYIGADALKGITVKSLYGMNIPVMSKNVLTCNFNTIERNVLLYVRVGGVFFSIFLIPHCEKVPRGEKETEHF